MKKIFPILIGFVIVLSLLQTGSIFATSENDITTQISTSGMGHGRFIKDDENWGVPNWQWMSKCVEIAERCNLFGRFSYNDTTGVVSGKFVEFIFNDTTGTITNYTVKRLNDDEILFTSVESTPFVVDAFWVSGAVFQYNSTEGGRVIVHNNPAAVLLHTAKNTTYTINYTLAPGFIAVKGHGNSSNVRIFTDNLKPYAIMLNGNSTVVISGQVITVTLEPGSHSLVRVQPNIGVGHRIQEMVQNKIFEGRIIAEISVVLNETYMYNWVCYQQGARNVNISSMKRNMMELHIQAEFNEGKIIIINIDNETVKTSKPEEITVTFDGTKVKQSTSAEALLSLPSTEQSPSYWLTSGDEGLQMLFYIPHFSDHVIAITWVEQIANFILEHITSFIVGGVVAVVAVCLGMYFVSKRESKKNSVIASLKDNPYFSPSK